MKRTIVSAVITGLIGFGTVMMPKPIQAQGSAGETYFFCDLNPTVHCATIGGTNLDGQAYPIPQPE